MEESGSKPRWPRAFPSPIQINALHLRNPVIIALWSAAFPGFGHLSLGSYIRGFLLVGWEIFINIKANLNLVILYTFTGRFHEAESAADVRWFGLYMAIYMFAIWDSYRSALDLNKFSILAERSSTPPVPFIMNSFEITYLAKRSPTVAMCWSALMPGTGHIYAHRVPTGAFLFVGWLFILSQSHQPEVLHYTFLGEFAQAASCSSPEWFLFLPSIYGYSIWNSYVHTIECNKLFDAEQAAYLKKKYPLGMGKMPV